MRFSGFQPSLPLCREIVRGGAPSFIRQSCASMGILVFNHAAGLFGDAAVAAISVVQRVVAFAMSAILGFGQGFQPVCGFNFGAQRYDRVIEAFTFCIKLVTLLLLIPAVFAAIFAPNIIALFRADDPEVIAIGAFALRMQCLTLPLMGFVVLSNMMLQTIGDALKASLVAIFRSGLFLVPSILILVRLFGLTGLEISQTVADILTISVTVPLGVGTLRKMKARQSGAKIES